MKINEKEQCNAKEYGQFIKFLEPKYDNRDSFYKKAKILEYNGIRYLQSYNTIVAKIENGEPVINGWYSQTTGRHINGFLQQNGFDKMSKKEMEEE